MIGGAHAYPLLKYFKRLKKVYHCSDDYTLVSSFPDSFRDLEISLIKECDLTQEECGNRLGKKRSTIANFLRLLKLPSEIQDGLKKEKISVGHARALINIKEKQNQLNIYQDIIENGFSVREVEQLAKDFSERNYKYKGKKKKIDSDDIIPFGHQKKLFDLSKNLNVDIQFKRNKKGSGKIIIPFSDDEKLSEIFNKLKI